MTKQGPGATTTAAGAHLSADWRTRPVRMCRFDYVTEMLPDDRTWLEEHAQMVRQELHANLDVVRLSLDPELRL